MMSVQKSRRSQADKAKLPEVIWPTRAEARQMFDTMAQETVGMSGEAFLKKLDAGDFSEMPDDWEHMPFVELATMSGFGRSFKMPRSN